MMQAKAALAVVKVKPRRVLRTIGDKVATWGWSRSSNVAEFFATYEKVFLKPFPRGLLPAAPLFLVRRRDPDGWRFAPFAAYKTNQDDSGSRQSR